MRIPDKGDFQPSAETLKKWLATRKPSIQVGGVQMPGYYIDAGNGSDTVWFYIALTGEFIGLFATIYGGAKNGGIFMTLAILATIMFMFCDFFFADKLHRNEANKTQLASLKLLESDENKAKIAKLSLEQKKGQFLDFLLQTGIIIIALIKVAGILLLGLFNNLILYIPFFILYLIVAYVHLKHTGYFIAYVTTQRRIDKEHERFANGEFKAQAARERVHTKSKLSDIPAKHNPHEIIADVTEEFSYLIKAKGILTDNDIIGLINGQENGNKIELFKACRKLQVENMQANA